MLTSRITEGENRNFKTSLKQTLITIMVTSIYVFFWVVVVSFTHFKWLTFKELI